MAIDIQSDYSEASLAIKMCRNSSESEYDFLQDKVTSLFSRNTQSERALTAISVRSLFDLYLQARAYPKGSEIIITAVNIPDMC